MTLSDAAGDRVTLELDDKVLRLAETYRIESGLFKVPCTFDLELGSRQPVKELLALGTPGKTFKLRIGGNLQFQGRIDGHGAHGSASSKSTVRIHGRDHMAALFSKIRTEKTYEENTPAEIVRIALDAVGLKGSKLVTDNSLSRTTRAGVKISTLTGKQRPKLPPRKRHRSAKIAKTWLDLIHEEIEHAGLFLWQAANGDFVLAAPDPDQEPVARIYRPAGGGTGASVPEDYDFENDTSRRFSTWEVYGTGGGEKSGAHQIAGHFEDPEMIAYGFTRAQTYQDRHATSDEEAAFYASRKLAESRREGWRLTYTEPGHTTDAIDGSGRLVWTTDTIIRLDDYELGFHGNYYVENCIYNGNNSASTTAIRLMRTTDLVFGSDQE